MSKDESHPTAALLAEIERFLSETGSAAYVVGKGALNDPNLVSDLRQGRELRHRQIIRVRAFMKAERANAMTRSLQRDKDELKKLQARIERKEKSLRDR